MSNHKHPLKETANARALFAYEQVDDHYSKNYTSYVKKMPALIMNNGLANTVAFATEKGKKWKEWKEILDDLEEWLKSDECPIPSTLKEKIKKGNFSKSIILLNSDEYRIITREILNYLNWLRRFAAAKDDNKKVNSQDE